MNQLQIQTYLKSVAKISGSTYHYIGHGEAGYASGTGFIIDKKRGLIVTCRHLVRETTSNIEITFYEGTVVSAKAIYIDPWIDFAILEYDPTQMTDEVLEVQLADARDFHPGTKVIAPGANEGSVNSYKIGEIIKTNDVIRRNASHVQTTLDLSGGSSGSPVFTNEGYVIGLHTCGTNTMSWELNAIYIKNALAFLSRDELPRRQDIGVQVNSLPVPQAIKFYQLDHRLLNETLDQIPQTVLLCTRDFSSGLNLIRPGDIIIAVDDIIVGDDVIKFEQIINCAQETVRVTLMRWGELLDMEIPVNCAYNSLPSDYLVFGGGVFHDITDSLRAIHRLGPVTGVMLSQVHYNAPACGIGAGSRVKADERVCVIRSINGQRVEGLEDMCREVAKLNDNDIVVFDLEDVLHGWGPALESFKLSLEFFPTVRHKLAYTPQRANKLKRLAS